MLHQNSSFSSDLDRGKREKIPFALFKDFVTHYVVAESPSLSALSPSSSSCTPYPTAHYINCTNFLEKCHKFLAFIISHTKPKYLKEMLRRRLLLLFLTRNILFYH